MSDVEILREIMHTGGASWNLAGQLLHPTSGYIVADGNSEEVYPVGDRTQIEEVQIAAALQHYTRNYWNRVVVADGALFFGAWMSVTNLFLDLSEHIMDRAEAVQVGRKRGELSIYECETGKVLYI